MSNVYSKYQIENGVIVANDKDVNLIFEDIDKISSKALEYYFSKNPNIESVSFPDLEIIEDNGLNYAFLDCTNITSVSFPELTTVEENGLNYAFKNCTNISGSISFPKLTTIGDFGLYGIFQESTGITSISFPELLTVGDYGLSGFAGSSKANFTTISFPKLVSLGEDALYCGFRYSTLLTSISFPELTTIGDASLYYLCEDCTNLTSISFPKVTTIGKNGLAYGFTGCTNLSGSINFSKLTDIGYRGLEGAFPNITGITSVNLSKLKTVGQYGLQSAFSGCSGITSSIDFTELETVEEYGMKNAFISCSGITSVSFPKLKSLGSSAMRQIFSGANISGIVNFPKLTTIQNDSLYNAFSGCTGITELHFRADSESTIKSHRNYSMKFGASNATIYYDLGLIYVDIVPNISDCTIYLNDQVTASPFLVDPDVTNTYYVYKDDYCLYKGTKTATIENENQTLTENITMSSTGKSTTLNVTVPTLTDVSSTILTVDYIVDGITFKTETRSVNTNTTQTFTTIKVPNNTQLTYKIRSDNYETVLNTITPSDNTIDITLQTINAKFIELSYPFTSNSSYLNNLIDDNNFTIFDNTKTPASCIVSGSKSYKVSNGFSTGYIKFKTPNTLVEDYLRVTVVCTCYAENYSDYGIVFINTSGTLPSSNSLILTGAGQIDSTYGEILYQGYNNQSTTFKTVTSSTLTPNTDYYLCFFYRKDSYVNSNWDRLAIQSIKFPVTES